MMSQRAKEACERMEPYPVGSAAQWARRNWNEAVLPFMEEFHAALRNRSAAVGEAYFHEGGPLFLFSDVKAMHALACEMKNETAQEKATIMNDVFIPYERKWQEILAAIIKRNRTTRSAVGRFRTRFALVADAVRLMFAVDGLESRFDAMWNLRCKMIEAFGVVRERVCTGSLEAPPRRTHENYCLTNAELAALFNVSVKTIVRWKDERNTTEEAINFRGLREFENAMRQLASDYRSRRRCRPVRVSYIPEIHDNAPRMDRLN